MLMIDIPPFQDLLEPCLVNIKKNEKRNRLSSFYFKKCGGEGLRQAWELIMFEPTPDLIKRINKHIYK